LQEVIGQVGHVHDPAVLLPRRGPARGAALLECVLALALFVACGMAVLAMVDHAVDSVAMTRDAEQAADVARSAMARIEAGLTTPQTLNGPLASNPGDEGGDSQAAADGSWALEVQTESSQFEGLTKVSVRAYKQVGDRELASYTLHQLVRLTEKSDEPAGTPGSPKARRGKT
jgi:hypothetical protein